MALEPGRPIVRAESSGKQIKSIIRMTELIATCASKRNRKVNWQHEKYADRKKGIMDQVKG
jgi:hypothetical protein